MIGIAAFKSESLHQIVAYLGKSLQEYISDIKFLN